MQETQEHSTTQAQDDRGAVQSGRAGKNTQPKHSNDFRPRFVDEYCAAQYNRENITQAEIAIRAGYSPKTAYAQASALLKKPEIQEQISAKMARLTAKVEWSLEVSAREARNQYTELARSTLAQDRAIAFKYKENLDKLHALLVERNINENRNINTLDDASAKSAEDLAQEALKAIDRLKSDTGVGVDKVAVVSDKGC